MFKVDPVLFKVGFTPSIVRVKYSDGPLSVVRLSGDIYGDGSCIVSAKYRPNSQRLSGKSNVSHLVDYRAIDDSSCDEGGILLVNKQEDYCVIGGKRYVRSDGEVDALSSFKPRSLFNSGMHDDKNLAKLVDASKYCIRYNEISLDSGKTWRLFCRREDGFRDSGVWTAENLFEAPKYPFRGYFGCSVCGDSIYLDLNYYYKKEDGSYDLTIHHRLTK